MFRRILSLVLITVLCLLACACGGGEDNPAASDTASGNSSVTDSATDATETNAKLTVTVSEKKIETFKSDRPYDKSKEDISLILVAGQSNFHPNNGYPREYGYQDHIPEPPTVTSAGKVYSSPHLGSITKLTDDRDMVNLCNPSRGNGTFGGVSPAFGAQWAELTGTTVVFVQAALGGVGMHEWVPNLSDYNCSCKNIGEGLMLSRAIENFTKSYEALSKEYNIVYMGYIWNQGEHENENNSAAACTVNSDKTYYDAYLSMHNVFIEELGMDFGGISMVRQHRNGVTPEASRSLTIARNAQYKLCSDIDNLFLLSTISETVTLDMMDPTLTSHYSQQTFNTMGYEMANNLSACLGISERTAYDGMFIYSTTGDIIGRFDQNGKLTEGIAKDGLWERSDISNHILARPNTLGNPLTVGYKLTVNGQDMTEKYLDQFGAINWLQLNADLKVKQLAIECVKQ